MDKINYFCFWVFIWWNMQIVSQNTPWSFQRRNETMLMYNECVFTFIMSSTINSMCLFHSSYKSKANLRDPISKYLSQNCGYNFTILSLIVAIHSLFDYLGSFARPYTFPRLQKYRDVPACCLLPSTPL